MASERGAWLGYGLFGGDPADAVPRGGGVLLDVYNADGEARYLVSRFVCAPSQLVVRDGVPGFSNSIMYMCFRGEVVLSCLFQS